MAIFWRKKKKTNPLKLKLRFLRRSIHESSNIRTAACPASGKKNAPLYNLLLKVESSRTPLCNHSLKNAGYCSVSAFFCHPLRASFLHLVVLSFPVHYDVEEDEADNGDVATQNATPVPSLDAFYTAMVQFQMEIQPLIVCTLEEACVLVRKCLDACATKALETRKILPRFWFERPFLLEQESQHERFLASTKIMNVFAAQSLLQRASFQEICLKKCDIFLFFIKLARSFV